MTMVGLPARDREAHVAHWAKLLADDTIVNKTIEFDGQVVGNIGCWENEGERLVGYFIARSHWGKGIATAALRGLLSEVKERPLLAHVATHNLGSTRVLEKCGFTMVEGSLHTGDDGIEEMLMKLETF